MAPKAKLEQMERSGKVHEFREDELFFKFIREYLCWFEKDYGKQYKLVSVHNGVF